MQFSNFKQMFLKSVAHICRVIKILYKQNFQLAVNHAGRPRYNSNIILSSLYYIAYVERFDYSSPLI